MLAVEVIKLSIVVVLSPEADVIQLEVRLSDLASHGKQDVVAGVRSFVWFHVDRE